MANQYTAPIPTEQRFWSHVECNDLFGCWNWLGYKDRRGYAKFSPRGQARTSPHRFSYELHNRPIPSGLVNDHLCRNPSCVNPSHLEAVTSRENSLRGNTTVRRHIEATHCAHGHLWDAENTGIRKGRRAGQRECRACWREAWRRKNW